MKKLLALLFVLFVITFFYAGCYYDKSELVYPQSPVCDTVNMKYSADVVPILSANCYVCHGGTATSSNGRKFDTYALLKNFVNNGQLVSSITHTGGVTPMPYNMPKLPECSINKILDWINRGALNN